MKDPPDTHISCPLYQCLCDLYLQKTWFKIASFLPKRYFVLFVDLSVEVFVTGRRPYPVEREMHVKGMTCEAGNILMIFQEMYEVQC